MVIVVVAVRGDVFLVGACRRYARSGGLCRRGVLVARQLDREEGGGFDSMFILSLSSFAFTRFNFVLNKTPLSDLLPYHFVSLP